MPTDQEKITFFETRLPGCLDLLRQMVSINSFTANRDGVNRLGRLTADVFGRLGFTPEFVPSTHAGYGDHLFLTRKGASPQTIAMISHLDTVFSPEEEARDHFHWRIDGDRIYGPGTEDIKGGTVMALMVLEGLQEFHPRLFEQVTWIVALDATEEVLSTDFGQYLLDHLPAETLACLVFEGGTLAPSACPLVAARKGRATYKITVEGKSAHAGNRHAQGANAIVQMAHTVQKVAGLTDYAQDLTFNVGVIQGGVVVNRVPHFAEAQVEMRAFDPDVFDQGVRSMLALHGASHVASQDGYPCKVEIRLVSQNAPWPRNPQTDRLFNHWREAGRELGMEIIPEERGGLSDGNLLWKRFPTLDGLGPTGDNSHCSEQSADGSKEQEYVLISSFVPKALLNSLAIARLCDRL